MTNYVLIFVWLLGCFIVTNIIRLQKPELVCGKIEYRYYWVWAFIVFLPVMIWAGTRSGIGDTGVYREMFQEVPLNFTELPSYLQTVEKDKGFTVFTAILKFFIGNNDTAFFVIIAFIQGICLLSIYRKYSKHFFICFFLFLASTDYISWMFNGMRQFLVATILFACMGLILHKHYLALLAIIAIVATIHGSAWIMIPMVFVVQGKAWNKKTVAFIVLIIILLAGLNQFTSVLDSALADTQYNDVLTNEAFTNDDGTNVLRVVIYAIPALLAFIGRRIIWEADDPVINLCTNMSIISAGLYVVSKFTSGIYIGRLPIYFSLYSYILLPWEIEHFFTKSSQRIMFGLLIFFYLLYYYYQMAIAWGYQLF